MLRVTGADGFARKDTKIILVRAKCPYVQFALLVFLLEFAVGVTNGRERERAPKSLGRECACVK